MATVGTLGAATSTTSSTSTTLIAPGTYYQSRGAGMTRALIGKQTKVSDVTECKAKCTADTRCLAISFKATTSRCRLSSASTIGGLAASASYEAFAKIVPTPVTTETAPTETRAATATATMQASAMVLAAECRQLHGHEDSEDDTPVLQVASGSCPAVADRINAIMTACPTIKGKYSPRNGATCSVTAEGGSSMLAWANKSLNRKFNLALGAFYDAAGIKKGKLLEKKPRGGSATEKLFAAHRETKRGTKCKAIARALNNMLVNGGFNCAA